MAKSLDFFQIYFKDEQKAEIYDFATPYLNKVLTPYFENSVISELVPNCNADYVSVCSWRLKMKRGDMHRLEDKALTQEKILSKDFDVAVLTPRSNNGNPILQGSTWHKKPFTDAINDLSGFIKIPNKIKNVIYENHFIARNDIYKDYVANCLNPVIDFMSTRDVYFADDTFYANRKTSQEREDYFLKTGKRQWPIAPFILERLFSIWINDKGFKVIPL